MYGKKYEGIIRSAFLIDENGMKARLAGHLPIDLFMAGQAALCQPSLVVAAAIAEPRGGNDLSVYDLPQVGA